MGLLLKMSVWQLKNTVLKALRSPKTLVPALFFAAFFGWGTWSQIASLFTSRANGGGPITLYVSSHAALSQTALFLLLVLLSAGVLQTGFKGGSLRFVPADIDYLFAAPFSRRQVLFTKLFGRIARNFLFLAALLVYLILGGWKRPNLPGWAAYAAFGLCLGSYGNLAVAMELVFALNRWKALRHVMTTGLILLVGWIGYLGWRHGLAGVTELGSNRLLSTLFYPCRSASQAAVGALSGHGGAGSLWPVIGFYLATLGLLFARNENYYEAALTGSERIWQYQQAQRENPWNLNAGAKRARRRQNEGIGYALRPFGTGAGALFWAHLAAAAKSPFPNFYLPTLASLIITLFALHYSDTHQSDTIISVAAFYYLAAGLVGGILTARQSLQRQGLIRPLPITARQAVAAEVGPRFLLTLPFYIVAALTLLLARGSAETMMILMLLCLPGITLCFHLLQYTLTLWYPSTEDRLQGLVTDGLQLILTLLLLAFLALFGIVPPRFGAPDWLTALIFFGGTLLTAAFLGTLTIDAYANHQPEGSPVRFDKAVMKRFWKPVLAGVALLAVALTVGARVNQIRNPPPAPLPPTVRVHVGDIALQVTETGTLEPVDKVDVKSKAAGRLLAIPIQEGQFVQKGQLIALVDRSLIDPQLTRDQAQLRQAQARLAQTQAEYALQVKQTGAAIAQAQAGLLTAQAHLASVAAGARPQELAQQTQAVDRARITFDDALRTQKRRAGLLGKGFISQADYDSSQVAVDTAASSLATAKQALLLMQAGPRVQDVADAQAQVAAARVQLSSARANSGQDAVKGSDIVQARASVAQISGDIAQLQVNIADTRIVAPASGIVLKKYKEVNEIVQSATTGFSDTQAIVATLGSRLEVKVGINEVDIAKVGAASSASISVDALPGVVFLGRVSEIAPASTNAFDGSAGGGANAIAKFSVKVGFARYDARLRSGMSANVAILSAARRHAILLPLEAVPFAGSEGDVTLYRVLGPPRKRHIVLGLRTATEAEVLRGLSAGQRVLVAHGK